MNLRTTTILTALTVIAAGSHADPRVNPQADAAGPTRLKLVDSGAREKLDRFAPQKLFMTSAKPAGLVKEPAGLSSPRYGVLPCGFDEDAATAGWIVITDGAGEQARLWIDANRDGDLTDDPAVTWKLETVDLGDGKTSRQHRGGGRVALAGDQAGSAAGKAVNVGMYQFAPAEGAAPQEKQLLFYYRDSQYEGSVEIEGKPVHVYLIDELVRGDYRGNPGGEPSGVWLLLDLNGDAKIDAADRVIDVRDIFRIGDLNYEIVDMARDGSQFRLQRTVKPLRPSIGTAIGRSIPKFTRTTLDGKTINFPDDYAGKIVFVDFWATHCPVCRDNIEEVVTVQAAYKEDGFVVLGVSLDNPGMEDKIREVCKENGMDWPEIHESQVWNSKLVKLLEVTTTPSGFLVDGDNGEILAKDRQLRNGNLEMTVKLALDRRKRNLQK